MTPQVPQASVMKLDKSGLSNFEKHVLPFFEANPFEREETKYVLRGENAALVVRHEQYDNEKDPDVANECTDIILFEPAKTDAVATAVGGALVDYYVAIRQNPVPEHLSHLSLDQYAGIDLKVVQVDGSMAKAAGAIVEMALMPVTMNEVGSKAAKGFILRTLSALAKDPIAKKIAFHAKSSSHSLDDPSLTLASALTFMARNWTSLDDHPLKTEFKTALARLLLLSYLLPPGISAGSMLFVQQIALVLSLFTRCPKYSIKFTQNGKVIEICLQITLLDSKDGFDKHDNGFFSRHPKATALAVCLGSAVAAPLVLGATLSLAGFGAGGVLGGSAAAGWQSMIGGAVARGSLFALCQQAGMTGAGTLFMMANGLAFAGATGANVVLIKTAMDDEACKAMILININGVTVDSILL